MVEDPRQPHGESGLFMHEPGAPCVVCDRERTPMTNTPRPDPLVELREAEQTITRAVAEMISGTAACETGHKPGQPHVHWEPFLAYARLIAAQLSVARAALAASEEASREDEFPHRSAWRHASWCEWERGSETECTCGLDGLRRGLTAARLSEPSR